MRLLIQLFSPHFTLKLGRPMDQTTTPTTKPRIGMDAAGQYRDGHAASDGASYEKMRKSASDNERKIEWWTQRNLSCVD